MLSGSGMAGVAAHISPLICSSRGRVERPSRGPVHLCSQVLAAAEQGGTVSAKGERMYLFSNWESIIVHSVQMGLS